MLLVELTVCSRSVCAPSSSVSGVSQQLCYQQQVQQKCCSQLLLADPTAADQISLGQRVHLKLGFTAGQDTHS